MIQNSKRNGENKIRVKTLGYSVAFRYKQSLVDKCCFVFFYYIIGQKQ